MYKFSRLISDSAKELKNVKSVAVSGILTALDIVLQFFTVVVSNVLQFSFSFLAVAAAGMLYGPITGGIVGAIGDVLGYFAMPSGPFFVGFTFNAFLTGFMYGAFLYKKQITVIRVLMPNLILVLLENFFLNPLWLSIMYGRGFVVVLSARIVSTLVMLPVHVALLYFVLKAVQRANALVYKRQNS